MILKITLFAQIMGALVCAQSMVVNLAEPDSNGWIRLYDGTNENDFYTIYNGPNTKGSFPDHGFVKGGGDTIQVTAAQVGHIIHKQPFSHYRAKFQFHYPNNSHGNSGMLFHIQPDDPMYNGLFPRSIESQGDPNQGMAQVWCIGNVWITIRLRPGTTYYGDYFGYVPTWDPTQEEVNYGNENQTGKRAAAGKYGWQMPVLTSEMNNLWTEMEVDVHGNDTIVHKLNGDTIIQYRNPRVSTTSDPSAVDNNVIKTLSSGLLGWQAEGKEILYRNIMVKLYPEDPLYDQLYTVGLLDKLRKSSAFSLSWEDNELVVDGSMNREYHIEIRDIEGRLVNKVFGDTDKAFKLPQVSNQSGIYFAYSYSESGNKFHKFIAF